MKQRSGCVWLARYCVVAMALLLAMPAVAQVQNGTLTGTVTDPQGASVPKADVTITNMGTNYTVTMKTNDDGLFRVPELPVGRYKIKVTASGFKTSEKTNIVLNAGTIERVDFQLSIGQVTEVISVEAVQGGVETEDSKLAVTVGGGQVANLPLNGRNVYSLSQLAPGAVNADGVMFENSDRGTTTIVNGLRSNFSGYLLNGVSNKGLSGGASTLVNPDIVEEFQQLTLNMSAQYGNSAASVINLVTKSGTNDLHGSLFYFIRNDALDANSFFRNRAEPRVEKSPLRFNQFGGSVSGPILKDKLFYTASYQGARFTAGAPSVPIVVESPEWRQAIISAFPNSVAALLYSNFAPSVPGTPLKNLTDFVLDGDSGGGFSSFAEYLCQDFSNATVAARLQALLGVTAQDQADMAALFNGMGCSVIPGLRPGAVSRTIPFRNSSVAVFETQTDGNLVNGNEWSTRIDYNLKNDRFFGEFYWQKTTDSIGPSNNNSGPRGFLNPQEIYSPNFQASWVHTFSPNLLNEAKVGFARNRNFIDTATPGVPSIGIFDGASGFGSYNGYPQFFIENIYSYEDMVSINKGKHNLKTGVSFRRNIENSEFNVARPSYYFFDQLYFAVDAPFGQVAGVDPGFVTGRPAELSGNNRAWRNLEFGAFFQDDWKVHKNLTLNLGVRYDLYRRHVEKFGRQTTFIPGPGSLTPAGPIFIENILNANIPAGQPGCSTPDQLARRVLAGVCGPGGFAITNALGGSDKNNVGPRAGAAWDLFGNAKTVLRGGYGISYEGTLYNPLSNSRWNPPFYSFNAAFNDLGGGPDVVIYGPQTPGQTPTFTGPPTNPGQGTGAQATGNLTGWQAGNTNAAFLTGIVFPAGIKDPLIHNFYFGIQQEFLPTWVLEVNYVGTRGRNLFRAQQVNRVPGGRLTAGATVTTQGRTLTGLGRRRLNPNYGVLRAWENISHSTYNALQASVRKQMSRGFMFQLNYTWSHSLDNGSDWHSGATSANGGASGDGYSLDQTRPDLDYGNSTFDIRHRLVFNYVWELPWYKGRRDLLGHILGGWQYNGIWAFQTGAHWTPYDNRLPSGGQLCTPGVPSVGGDYNCDGEPNDRPDVRTSNNVNATRAQYANGYFGGNALSFFATPCAGCNGNLGRNTFVGPGQFNVDQSLFKNFLITERIKMTFRFEMFNAFNRANFLLPSSSTGANFANRLNSSNFGQAAGTTNPRQIQFGLRITF